MPTIELPPKKKRTAKERNYRPTERAQMASDLYNTDTWRKIRRSYLMGCPECEICSELGRITLADEVHHINEISKADNPLDAMDKAYDSNNLMAVCKKCHMHYHGLIDSKRHPSEADRLFLKAYNEVIKKHNKYVNSTGNRE